MPLSGTHQPKAATCEDVDEETQTIKSDSCTSANVSKKRSQSSDLNRKSTTEKRSQNGSDSGYSSKTGTNESLASGRRMSTGVAATTKMMDRPSQPYSYTPASTKPPARPTIKVDTAKEKTPKPEKRYRHPQEAGCYTCNTVGYHCELAELPPPTPDSRSSKSPQKGKTTQEKPKQRRQSSVVRERPTSWFAPASTPVYLVSPFYAEAPPIAYSPYAAPPTPIASPPFAHPPPFVYDTGTPVSATSHEYPPCTDPYCGQHLTPQYTEQPMIAYPSQYEPSHMQPQHHPQSQLHYHLPAPSQPQPQAHRTSHELERVMPNSAQHRAPISKSSKAQMDRAAMPPPARQVSRRPSNDSGHYDSRRQSFHYEEDERPRTASKRSSRDMSAGLLPPSAWKGAVEAAERPRSRKSASYSDAILDDMAHSHRESLPRRATDPVEERAAAIEAYQERVNKSSGVVVESLKVLDKHHKSPSDTGTSRSKTSARAKRSSTVVSSSNCTNINVDGVQLSIPQGTEQEFNLTIRGVTVSMGGDPDATQQKSKERKQLERASSNASRETRPKPSSPEATDEPHSSRRTSKTADRPEKVKISPNSSKRSSRAPSKVRSDHERARIRESLQHPEQFYGA